jgi:CDP-glycerol glycerophosphotransferase (TagB/SpsB family)
MPESQKEHLGGKTKAMEAPTILYEPTFSSLDHPVLAGAKNTNKNLALNFKNLPLNWKPWFEVKSFELNPLV